MTFFFDRCLALRLARMIAASDRDHSVTHQDDDERFTPRTTDVQLIHRLKQDAPAPVFLTADQATRRRPGERLALAESGLTIVFFRAGWHSLDMHTQAVKLLTIWPQIVRQISRVKEPTAFEISPRARKVDRLCPTADLIRGGFGR